MSLQINLATPDNFADLPVFQRIVGGHQLVRTAPVASEGIADMLAPLGLTLDDRPVVMAAFLAVAEGFAVQIAERCADFHAAGGFDLDRKSVV